MADRRSRRDLICEAALDLAAEGGNHALTHQASMHASAWPGARLRTTTAPVTRWCPPQSRT